MSDFGKREFTSTEGKHPARQPFSFAQGVVAGVCSMIIVAGAAVVGLSYIGLEEPRQTSLTEDMAVVLQDADSVQIPTLPVEYGSLPSFDDLTSMLSAKLDCGRIVGGSHGIKRIWDCDLGPTRTASVTVSEGDRGSVRNVRVIWNDHHRDAAQGYDPDREHAVRIVGVLAETIGASITEYESALLESESRDLDAANGLSARYTYYRGPSITERVIAVSNVAQAVASNPPVRSASSDTVSNAQFERMAKQAIQTFGYWCEGRVSLNIRPFSSTVNRQTYRAFCDNRSMNATYDIVNDRGRISITEAGW